MKKKDEISPKKIISRLRELVATSSVSSPDPSWDQGNCEVINTLADWAESIGFTCEVLDVSPTGHKSNLIATRGSGPGGLVLSGHADTVPFDAGAWKSDPFKLTERQGRLYGLGSTDMKGFFPLALAAASEFSDKELKQPLFLLATADEESSMDGARALAKVGRPKARAAIIGEPTSLVPIRMHKGISMFSVKVEGTPGHSSNPLLGNNALEGIYRVTGQMLELRDRLKKRDSNAIFDVPNPTLNLGSIHGGDSPNRICGEAEMQFDLRVTPDCNFDEVRYEIEEMLNTTAREFDLTINLRALMPPIPPFAQDSKSEIVQLAEQLTGHTAAAVDFATEAPFFQNLGIDTIIMGPGSIKRAHQPNEYLELQQIKPYINLLKNCIAKFCL